MPAGDWYLPVGFLLSELEVNCYCWNRDENALSIFVITVTISLSYQMVPGGKESLELYMSGIKCSRAQSHHIVLGAGTFGGSGTMAEELDLVPGSSIWSTGKFPEFLK